MSRFATVPLVAALGMVGGCSNDPGSMNKSEIEDKLRGALKLKAVTLTELPSGEYEGIGDKDDGSKVSITVRQKQEDMSLWYTAKDGTGNLVAGGIKEFSAWGVDSTTVRAWRWLKTGVLALLVVLGIGYVIYKGLFARGAGNDENA